VRRALAPPGDHTPSRIEHGPRPPAAVKRSSMVHG
jgi:hypothetical protein